MKLKRKHAAAMALVLSVLLLPVGAFAAFTDLGEAAWATGYIEAMSEEGIVTGYDDGTFRPNANISKYASVLMVYRTLKAADLVTDAEQAANITRHMGTIAARGVPNWPDLYGAVAFCLEKGILTTGDLVNFQIGDVHTNAGRSEVAVYLGKAMNLYLEENLNVLYSLNFKDAGSVSAAARPYVYLLNKHDVISGDTEGYFNPDAPITRAAMAKMLTVSLELLRDVAPQAETKSGVITSILGDTERVVVRDAGDESVSDLYNLTDVEILVDGRLRDVEDLELEMTVLLTFENGTLKRLSVTEGEVSGDLLQYDGFYRNHVDMGAYAILTIEMPDGDREAYRLESATGVTRDGEVVPLSRLETGDPVNFEADGEVLDRLEAFSKTQTVDGVFLEIVEHDDYEALKLKNDAGQFVEIELSDDVDVEKNDRSRNVGDLINGDFVVVTTEYGKAVDIVASGLETNAEGVVKSILIAETPELTLVDSDGTERTYEIHADADIEIDGYDRTLYDLRLDYTVRLVAQGDVATSVEADSLNVSDTLDAYVISVYSAEDKLRVRYYDGEEYVFSYVYEKSDTAVYSAAGGDADFSDIRANDKVFIYGRTLGTKYYADRIFILE